MAERNDSARRTERAASHDTQNKKRAPRRAAQAGGRPVRRSPSANGNAANTGNGTARRSAPRPANGSGSDTRRRAPQQYRPALASMREREREQEVSDVDFGAIVRGIIAVALTCLIVCIIVIMFAKTLFVSDAELQKTAKTGHLTETAFEMIEPVEQQLREEVVTTKATKKKKKTTTTQKAEEAEKTDLPEGIDTAAAGDYTVNSPVYLHPTADANSANLATLPYGVTVKVLGQSYGWYYLEYEGEKGYAWGTYFNKVG